jgi:ATP-binding cassette, subfamily B, heavy metal transporter
MKNSLLYRLRPYLWPSDRPDLKRRIGVAFLLLLAAKAVTVWMPYTFKWATDALVAVSQSGVDFASALSGWQTVALLTLLYAGARILMALLTQMRDGVFARVAMHAVRNLSLKTFAHMHALSLRFHLERKTGGLTRVLERGRKGIEDLSRMFILTLIPTIFEFVLVLGVLGFEFGVRYSVIVFLMVMVYLAYTYKATEWRIGIRRRMNDSDTDANTKAIDSLLNYETVKYFGAERRETQRYDSAMAVFEKASVQTYTSLAVLNAGQAIIFTAGMALVLILGVYDVRAGNTTVGGFVMMNAMLLQLYIPLNFMGMMYRDIKQALTDIESMFAVLDQGADISDRPNAPPLRVSEGRVDFENVQFSYTKDRQILKGLSFSVPAGQTCAIVGSSGAGKSTLSRLLFRFYEPQGGCIKIDGQNIAEVEQGSLRQRIGMVPQDTVLFNDTIGYNIKYGRWDATDEEIWEAAEQASIAPFIKKLAQGMDTPVGERGLKLSGGEKQRIAIARTLLKAPPILVLDEATSALDSFTEKDIQEALEKASRGRTTLIIAHRLSTVVNADQILVLDHGLIAESGTHHELLLKNGLYAALWQRQRAVDAARQVLAEETIAEPETIS